MKHLHPNENNNNQRTISNQITTLEWTAAMCTNGGGDLNFFGDDKFTQDSIVAKTQNNLAQLEAFVARNPDFVMRTTKAQTSLCICTV